MHSEAKHVSEWIDRSAADVYDYVSDPTNIPSWARGLGDSVENVDGRWFVYTPSGRVGVAFVERNPFGVLDHEVTLPSGEAVYVPMRVLADGDGCEVVFTVRRLPDMSDDIAAIWPRLLADCGSPRQRLAYIHVPFCANHCLFCAFYRNAYTATEAATYAARVVAEIEREADGGGIRHHPIEAVYLGGGTPSALSADDLARILDTVRRRLPLAPDCEITLEGRIIHFDDDKIDTCIAAGVNRISVGVQSFDTAVRRRQGRRASKEEAIRFLEGIRDRNRVALVIDLLYGLPGQTLEVWREDLRIADDLAPDGIDLYGLNLIPGTPLHRAVAAGKLHPTTLQHLGRCTKPAPRFSAREAGGRSATAIGRGRRASATSTICASSRAPTVWLTARVRAAPSAATATASPVISDNTARASPRGASRSTA